MLQFDDRGVWALDEFLSSAKSARIINVADVWRNN